jgi:hypothetical protein
MKKTILRNTGLAGVILGLILFAITGNNLPHHLNWYTVGFHSVLIVGGLILLVRNLDPEG